MTTHVLTDAEIDELHELLDSIPEPLEPLNGSMLDGFLCGILVQPQRVEPERWLPWVCDNEGRLPPASFDLNRLHDLVLCRHAELDHCIEQREWFDPWIYELDEEDQDEDELNDDNEGLSHPALPWVAGFISAMELFPDVMDLEASTTLEPLAMIFQHVAAEDLEDADDLLEMIESLEPPADLTEAVEQLVRATLLLADASRPQNRRTISQKTTSRRH